MHDGFHARQPNTISKEHDTDVVDCMVLMPSNVETKVLDTCTNHTLECLCSLSIMVHLVISQAPARLAINGE